MLQQSCAEIMKMCIESVKTYIKLVVHLLFRHVFGGWGVEFLGCAHGVVVLFLNVSKFNAGLKGISIFNVVLVLK